MNSDDLDTLAQHHLDPLGITLTEAEADAQSNTLPTRYSSSGALETLRRLRARQSGRPTPTAAYAPTLPPISPLTVAAGEASTWHITDGQTVAETDDTHLIDTLAGMHASTGTSTHHTLVVDTPATLHHLARLARAATTHRATAQALDWWTQRADHPGSGAALVLTRALRLRWVTGTTSDAERHLSTWTRWLTPELDPLLTPAETVRALAQLLAAGHTLPGLLAFHEDDSYSWKYIRPPAIWSPSDSRRDAALGLNGRCQAAELYDSLRLNDPLVAPVAVRTGHLVEATVTELDPKTHTMTVAGHSLVSRLRAGARVQAWAGLADTARAEGDFAVRAGVITSVSATAQRQLILKLSDTVTPAKVAVGDVLTIRPREIDPFQQHSFRARYRSRYTGPQNWLARRAAPTPARRSVPMDVVIAAAE